MKKGGAAMLIVMIQMAASMPALMMASTPPPPPPTSAVSCPDPAKLGVCVDLLKDVAQVAAGDPVANQCCPVIQGVLGVQAATCLCGTIKSKLLDPGTVLPVALQLIAASGGSVGVGFQCPDQ